ncbi:MAG: hypothetical protein HKN17_06035 [Rhodothermales bacterium]|nr:hypothetical protein [Rhodothermales bacterium]
MRAFSIPALLIIMAAVPVKSASAQDMDAPSQAVLDTVQRFFDALESKDGDALRSVLTTQGITHALRIRGDSVVVVARPHDAAVASITGSDASLMERMFDPVVHVDDHLAVVWTPYDFHVNGTFSHCGTDIFSLIRVRDAWKIASITYTVEQDDCPERPPLENSP